MMIQKILVLTEFNELSEKAIEFAIKIAGRMQVNEIILLNIIIPTQTQAFTATEDMFHPGDDMSVQMNSILLERHNELINEQARKYSQHDIKITPQVSVSHSKTDLNQFMEEYEAGLLIYGVHEESSFLEKLSGSDSLKLARKVDYPIIIIKEDTRINEIKDIALSIDIDDQHQDGLNDIISFANAIGARLQFLHVVTDEERSPDEAIEKLRQLALQNNLTNHAINIVNNKSLENGIRQYVRKYNPDMIAVLSHGKGKIKTLIYGSRSEEIIEETDKPVFISRIH